MDSKNFAIGILSTTAVILFVGLMLTHGRPTPALAGSMTTTSGEYILTVGTVSIDDEEVVYVINAPDQKMIAYRFDIGTGKIEVVEGINLEEMAKSAAAGPAQPSSGTKGGRRP